MAPITNPEETVDAYILRLDSVGSFTYALVMIIVPLKLWCRRRAGGWANIGLDDYLSIASLFFANGFFWVSMMGMRDMLGRHVADLPDPMMIIEFLKCVWIAQLMYTFAITSTKLAVLAFYWRLFAVSARVIIWVVAGMCIAWFIGIFFSVIFSCLPVHAAWDVTITNAKCIPIRSIYLGGSIPNVILDLVVVLMPLPYVWRLQAPLAQRLILAGMFILGTFIAVVSLVRLIIFLSIPIATSGDVTFNFREIIVWSIVEINVGLICACMPSLKPAFAAIGLNRLFTFNGSRNSDNKSPGPSSGYQSSGFGGSNKPRPRKKGSTGGLFSTIGGLTKSDSEEELKTVDTGYGKNQTDIVMTRLSDDSTAPAQGPSPNEGISVQRDWSVYIDHSGARTGDGRI
ncbi:hypothetical protein IAQ61_006394 [Plenodomus lingam]|uniref:uncharacterized protein n=1 Tax=Leptosphaeria maculans TaxID=5022 RepID=UPI003318C035|nr:hypothetical protein IAQ61_006394 [Plenodomus lingam]